jgi:hypothetical protein
MRDVIGQASVPEGMEVFIIELRLLRLIKRGLICMAWFTRTLQT